MRKPGDTVRITGSMLISQLAAIEQTTSAATARFLRVLGTIIAINMPYRATLSASTTSAGSTLPNSTPSAVPAHQPGMAADIAP